MDLKLLFEGGDAGHTAFATIAYRRDLVYIVNLEKLDRDPAIVALGLARGRAGSQREDEEKKGSGFHGPQNYRKPLTHSGMSLATLAQTFVMKVLCVAISVMVLVSCGSSRLSSRASYTAASAAPASTQWAGSKWVATGNVQNSWETSIDIPQTDDNHSVANLVWVKNLPTAGGIFAKPIQVPCYVFMSESAPNSLLSLDRKMISGKAVITVSAERALTAEEQQALSKMEFRVVQVAPTLRNANYGALVAQTGLRD